MENISFTSFKPAEFRKLVREELTSFFAEFKQTPPPPVEIDQNLSISELAEYLKVSTVTIQKYKSRGIFKFYQAGRTVFFKKSEVDLALASDRKISKKG